MALHSLQQRGTTLATMVNNEKVGCLHTHVFIYTYGELDVSSTLADPTVLNSSGLNIAFKLNGGRPWMSNLMVMAVYLIACSHVRISSCSASNPAVQLPECVSVSPEGTKAQHRRDGEEGGAATRDGAEQSARGHNCGKGHRDRHA